MYYFNIFLLVPNATNLKKKGTSKKNPSGKTAAPKKGESVRTNEKGEYSKRVPDNWSGRVTPAKPGYIFHPANKDYQNMTIDTVKIAEDYRVESDLKFFISLVGNYMIPAQGNFSDVYGSGLLYPGIKAGYKLFRPIYIWGGYEVSAKSGTSPVFEEPSKWKESFLSMGKPGNRGRWV
jgi:hypothetical protein